MQSKHRGWIRVILIILPWLIVSGFCQYFAVILLTGYDYNNPVPQTSIQVVVGRLGGLLGTLFILWIFMRGVDKEKFINLGFQREGRFKEFLVGFGLGALIMVFAFLILWGIDQIDFEAFNFDFKGLILSIILFCCVAVGEEVLLRGYVLRNLMLSFNKYVALVVSSLLFAVMHGLNPNIDLFSLFGLFLAGLSLGVSYIYTKNLWFPIALHLGWNLFQSLFGFNVSGQDFYSLIVTSYTESTILNGGAFGFEGSILSLLIELICTFAIAYYYIKNKKSTTVTAN